jgi:hypothetical protein
VNALFTTVREEKYPAGGSRPTGESIPTAFYDLGGSQKPRQESGMRPYCIALIVAFGAAVGSSAVANDGQTPRAVIELFTSQGCSSCPSADRLLGELANDSSLVAMSLPIDYWDYLGWKDTLARPRHSARQRSYSKARGDREVYTPQVVVNGTAQVLGSDKGAIERAIQQTGKSEKLMVPVSVAFSPDRLVVTVHEASGAQGQPAEVWLCAVAKRVPVTITRGENRGKTIDYHNVVRRWVKLGEWTGSAQTRTLAGADFSSDGADSVAVIVQSGASEKPGKILGAALAKLR